MYYKDVIRPESWNDYIEFHKLYHRDFCSMIFDVAFIEACSEWDYDDTDYQWYTIAQLRRAVYENLLVKMFRCFFDSKGNDHTSFVIFQGQVRGHYLKDEYRDTVAEKIDCLGMGETEFRKIKNRLDKEVRGYRSVYIAHSLLARQKKEDYEVDLNDIKAFLEKECELYQALNFEPIDSYKGTPAEDLDIIFSERFDKDKRSAAMFLKYVVLSAKSVKRIDCTYRHPQFDEKNIQQIERIVNEINEDKK